MMCTLRLILFALGLLLLHQRIAQAADFTVNSSGDATAGTTIITGTPGHGLFPIVGGDVTVNDLALTGARSTNGTAAAVRPASPPAP